MRPAIALAIVLVLCATALPIGQAVADGGRGQSGRDPSAGLTADQAAQSARRQAGGGRVLSVEPTNGGYRVKILTPGGEVRAIRVDAQRR